MKSTLLFSLFLLAFPTEIRASASASVSSPIPFLIRGNEMQYETKQNKSQVIGNAYAERIIPSSSPGFPPRRQILTANNFSIHFQPANSDYVSSQNFHDIDYIEAEGNVAFQDGDLIIQAENCVYYAGGSSEKGQTAGRIICTQKVTLKKGQNTLKGEKAEANLQDGTYKVTTLDSSHKVEAVLSPSNSSFKK